jgi:NAD(P)H-nitrite reductase large subunit
LLFDGSDDENSTSNLLSHNKQDATSLSGLKHSQMSHTQTNFQPLLNTFSRDDEGEFSLENSKDAICICMQISRDALLGAIDNGCKTVKALSAQTGAGTVCGGGVATMAAKTAFTCSVSA